MCCWNARTVCLLGIVLGMAGVSTVRAESILKLDHAAKAKAAAKEFSPGSMAAKDDSDLDRYEHFSLAGKKKEQPALPAAVKKKTPEPPIQWDDKHSKNVKVKVPKLPNKPPKHEPTPPTSVQWAMAPTPMAPAAMELTTVPAPNSLWAGLTMISALAIWRWWASRRTLAN